MDNLLRYLCHNYLATPNMTIEPPMTLNRVPVGTRDKMCMEGVACPSKCMLPNGQQSQILYSPVMVQPTTPEQHIQEAVSPSSTLMYEQDNCDMKDLLSPTLMNDNFQNLSSFDNVSLDASEEFERSYDLGGLMSQFSDCPQLDTIWNNSNLLDTGQKKYKMEDVMMSHNANQGPTLAQLNQADSSVYDDFKVIDDPTIFSYDISSIICPPDDNKGSKCYKVNTCVSNKQTNCAKIEGGLLGSLGNKPLTSVENLPKTNTVERVGNALSTTCTINSPTQIDPMIYRQIKTEPASEMTSCSQAGNTWESDTSCGVNGQLQNPSPSKPSLHELLSTVNSMQAPMLGKQQQAQIVPSCLDIGSQQVLPRKKSPNSPDSSGSSSSLNRKWEEIKEFIEGEPEQKKIKTALQDMYADSDDDSDSDLEGDISDTESIGSSSSFVEDMIIGGKKEKRYFWQYNTQAKGPKGKRLCKSVSPNDPHVLNEFEDPVFDPDINDAQYKHSGRARKGDGNDITPNPYKLVQIGNQLKKLNRKIHDIASIGELPGRSKTRREKNKYASRACRLKKKAQHEANKIKLQGLNTEHSQLMLVLELIKKEVQLHVSQGKKDGKTLTKKLEALMKENLTIMIAGNTADYVNSILERAVCDGKSSSRSRKKSVSS